MKGGCKEFDILSSATAEPVIAEPHITSMPIDESCRWVLSSVFPLVKGTMKVIKRKDDIECMHI